MHPSASKGRRWELDCATLLGLKRFHNLGNHDDVGDLDDPAFVYECKDDQSRSPMQWWLQAEEERKRSTKPWAIVLAKARMPRPGEPKGWAQMSIEQWKELRAYIDRLETEIRAASRLATRYGEGQRIRVKLDNNVIVEGQLLGPVTERAA